MVAKALCAACLFMAFSVPVLAEGASVDGALTFQQTLAAAEAARSKAASVGGEWRDTQSLLDAAQEAAREGDLQKAMQLAETARRQGELGYEQAVSQKSVGHPLYLR